MLEEYKFRLENDSKHIYLIVEGLITKRTYHTIKLPARASVALGNSLIREGRKVYGEK